MDAFTDVSTPNTDELRIALQIVRFLLFDEYGRIRRDAEDVAALRNEIGRLSAALRKAEAEARR